MRLRFHLDPETGLPHIYDHGVIEEEVRQILVGRGVEERKMKKQVFPPGWDEERVRKVITHYDNQTEAEELAEFEAAFHDPGQTMMLVPAELVPRIAQLIAQHRERHSTPRPRKRKTPRKRTKAGRRTLAQKVAG
jgi:hypothetical protein